MTDVRRPALGVGTACPDFESLSCYADGELEPPVAGAIAAHVGECSHCATLTTRLREGLAADDARRDGAAGGSGCAGEEHLVLYAGGGLTRPERAALQTHLVTCDACIRSLTLLHRRLSVAAAVATPVPTGVQQRARLVLEAGLHGVTHAGEQPPRHVEPRGAALLGRLRGLLRVPVLAPVALAAGALLAVGLHSGSNDQSVSGERSRAIAPDTAKRRITAVEATVRSRPSMQSEVVATIGRGTVVEVAGMERDWYQVRLDGGRAGWVEREAIE
jgi:anti-sigma factor RsiW